MGMGIGRSAFMATTAIVCVATATPAFAQAKTFDVPAQSATTGIAELGRQADIQIVAARKDTQGKQVNAVRGDMTVEQALAVLLKDTGLVARSTGARTWRSEEHTSELQSLMRISYAVFCLKKKMLNFTCYVQFVTTT